MKTSPLPIPKIDLSKYNPSNVPPIDQIRIMEDAAFEDFIAEWLYSARGKQYKRFECIGGAGDKGRDIIGVYADDSRDYYQCKHYQKSLMPSDFTSELGKLCYNTFTGEIVIPRNYYIVASNDIGPALADLLGNSNSLKEYLVKNWDTQCSKSIAATAIGLNGNFGVYVQQFDFSIVQHCPMQLVINEHLPTQYGSLRFGTASVARPNAIEPDKSVDASEQIYIHELFKVYSEATGVPIRSLDELERFTNWYKHLDRQRRDYFSIEAIRRALRDSFTNEDEFTVLQGEVFSGIIDSYEAGYPTGIERLKAVLSQASSTQIQKSLLASKLSWIGPNEKKGACHLLVNEKELEGWVNEQK